MLGDEASLNVSSEEKNKTCGFLFDSLCLV